MRYRVGLGLLLLLSAFITNGSAQESTSAADSVENLRSQLLEVQTKEQDLRTRLEQLEESLKPENIERALAGVGSTRPEELRESRRLRLTIERDGVLAQLKTVETSKARLETALANAEVRAYQQSARRPEPEQMMAASPGFRYGWLMAGGGGFAALALAAGVLIYRRKFRLR